jgi:hypothetical protein
VVGSKDGQAEDTSSVGTSVGTSVGAFVGLSEGISVGISVGTSVGISVGTSVGIYEGDVAEVVGWVVERFMVGRAVLGLDVGRAARFRSGS